MKEIDKDDVPDASGGISDGCIPLPCLEPIFPGLGDPFLDPPEDGRYRSPCIAPAIGGISD